FIGISAYLQDIVTLPCVRDQVCHAALALRCDLRGTGHRADPPEPSRRAAFGLPGEHAVREECGGGRRLPPGPQETVEGIARKGAREVEALGDVAAEALDLL